jgi:hypothetical protein
VADVSDLAEPRHRLRSAVLECLGKVASVGPLYRTQTLWHSPPSLMAKLSSVPSQLSLCLDPLVSTSGHGSLLSSSESQKTLSKDFIFDCNGFVEFVGFYNQTGEIHRLIGRTRVLEEEMRDPANAGIM